jgi:hypothetical protein
MSGNVQNCAKLVHFRNKVFFNFKRPEKPKPEGSNPSPTRVQKIQARPTSKRGVLFFKNRVLVPENIEPVGRRGGQHLAEVGAAHGEHQPVRVEHGVAAAHGQVGQQLLEQVHRQI